MIKKRTADRTARIGNNLMSQKRPMPLNPTRRDYGAPGMNGG
jgi:hypothetical protein